MTFYEDTLADWNMGYTPEPEAHILWIEDNSEPDFYGYWEEIQQLEEQASFYETHELCYD